MDEYRHISEITRPHRKLLTLYTIRSLFALVFFPFVWLPLFFKYETLRYRFDDEGITTKWGLLWRREIFLTYARIQDIHLARGLIERWLGIATINIQTAAGSSSSEMSIVGLIEYEDLRDFLYLKMRGARFGEEGPDDTAEVATSMTSVGSVATGTADETVALLTDIRDELRALRAESGRA
jgi:putative membrane protein